MPKKMMSRKKPLPEWWTDWLTEISNADMRIMFMIMFAAFVPLLFLFLAVPFIIRLGVSDNFLNWICGIFMLLWAVGFLYLGKRKLDYLWIMVYEAKWARDSFYEIKAASYLQVEEEVS